MKIYCVYAEEESSTPDILKCFKSYEEAVNFIKNLKEKFKDFIFSYEENELVLDNDDIYFIIETELKE